MATIYVNGTDMEAAGYPLVGLEGWGAAVEMSYRATAVAGVRHQHVMPYPTVNPRTITVRLLIPAAKAATVAARGAALDTLLAYFPMDDEIALNFADDTTKVVYGRVTRETSVSVAENYSFAIPDTIVSFEITCFDPCKYDVSNTTVAVTNALATIAVGTVDCGGVFTITGAATNPVLTYADGSGNTIHTMTWTTALATGDTLAIDFDLLTAVKTYSTGTVSNVLSSWTAGDWFRFDPTDKDAEVGPKLQVSSGAGSLVYKRKWRS